MRACSLKLQFALLSAVLAVLALGLAGAVLLPVVRHRQLYDLDEQLARDAAVLQGIFAAKEAEILAGTPGVVAGLLPPNLRLRYLEVEALDGRVLHRSGNLRGLDLTGEVGRAHPATIAGQAARLRTARQGELVLHVGTRLGTLDKTQRDLAMSLLTVLPLVVLGAFGGGLLLGRRAVRPIAVLTAAAETISTERPGDHLPVPPTGDEVARLTEVLNRSFDRLQRAYEAAARFSADASHQLKTPLAVMRAGVDALGKMGGQVPEVQAEVEVLRRQSRRLTTMVDDLLLLAQVDAGRLELESGPSDLQPLLERVWEDLEALAAEQNVSVERSWPEALPCHADPRRVALILQNLLENAIKYTPPGGRIRGVATAGAAGVECRIANTGAPIAAAQCEAIFERFHRSGAGENVPGHGLGLNIARALARAHGGDLFLDRDEAGWTTFVLRLPRAPAG